MNPALAKLFKKIGAASLLLLACQVLLLLAARLLTKQFPAGGYGRFGLAMSFSVYAAQFIQWGMDQYLAVKFTRGSAAESQRLLGLLLRQKQIGGIIVLIVAVIAAMLWKPSSERELIFLGAVDGIVLGFVIPSVFDARAQTATWQFLAFLRHAAYLGVLLFFAAFLPDFFSSVAIVSIHALCIMLQVILEQLWIQKNYGGPQWPMPARDTVPLWRDAAPMAIAMLAQQALIFGGLPALHWLGNETQADAVNLSNQVTVAAASFLAAPIALLQVRIAQSLGDQGKFRREVWRAAILCAIAGLALSFALSASAGLVMRLLFSNRIADAALILKVDAWRLAPILASAPLGSALICLGRLRSFAIAHILALIAGGIIAVIYVPQFSGLAAAAAVAAGRFAFFIFCAAFLIMGQNAERPA